MTSVDYETTSQLDDDEIVFSDMSASYCVGIIDIIGSTRITSRLTYGKICEFYSTFLNFMTPIVNSSKAIVIKNLGDGMLWYFPKTLDCLDKESVLKSLQCGMEMSEANQKINVLMAEKKLPEVSYRISLDYGNVSIAKSKRSKVEDIFGSTVNMCSKINIAAEPNSVVIGGDLYQIVRGTKEFAFTCRGGYRTGPQTEYPIYTVSKSTSRMFYVFKH